MNIIINKKKLTPLIAIVLFILLGAFNVSSGIAIHMQGDGATFNLDKADPVGYGVYIPAPNMYTTMSISGSNQGNFTIMDWDGTPLKSELVNYPGSDVSYAYPWYFDNNLLDSTTNNDYINPWDVQWLNVSAYNAENDTLSPYALNTVFNYYVMSEGSELTVPLNNSMPMQIDVMIDNAGPKILKLDWLLDDSEQNPLKNINLISPSGKVVDFVGPIPAMAAPSGDTIFRYATFVAHISGTYRLLLNASYTLNPGYLNLEFLDFNIRDLTVNKVSFAGDGDDWPSYQDMFDNEWSAEWFRIKGNKGDKFSLDYGYDYELSTPFVSIFSPSEYGYNANFGISSGNYDIYFPKTGYVYISFTDTYVGSPYLASLYLKEIPVVEYNIGDNVTNIRVSRDQRKAIDFTIEQDSFVRFNYTEWGNGDAEISSLGTTNGIIYKDAKKLDGYEVLTPIETKTVDTMDFYYYYFPAGEYEAIIKNTNILYDGVLQISSNFVEWANNTIPVNSLTYPEVDGSQYITLEFGPDEYYSSLKEAQWIGINITEPGQYVLNTTIWTTDNSGASATGGVSQLYTYNDTGVGSYHSFGYPQPAFSTDGDNTVGDFLYIGASTRWTGMLLNFSIPGVGGTMTPRVYTGNWDVMTHSDGTNELTQDGVIEFSLTDPDFSDWIKGNEGFDIDPSIDENDYYWLRLACTSDYSGDTVPIIELITLLNQTIKGDVNFALLRESGYQYGDTWGPSGIDQPIQPNGLRVSRDEENDEFGTLEYDSSESFIIETAGPYTIGFEEGLYKLLIVPEKWDYSGSIKIRFAVENYWPYKTHSTYNISALTPYPNLHLFDINNYTATGYGCDNDTLYNYGLIKTYNHTEVSLGSIGSDQAYFLLEVYGKAYQWTQLVVAMQNVSSYNLYLLQDLPWVSTNGPNSEVKIPLAGWDNVAVNKTYEFGVHVDHFFLLFESHDINPNEIMTFKIALSQYNTTALYGSEIIASYTPPGPDLGPLVVTLLIVIPSAIGVAVVVVYVVKKKRIGVKHPT